ncbi:DUF6221 family protein [Streptomyces sp. NPDC090126]|uniref:DUF6221 family protein n=1 Tax=Streptomyces sp. NPDC090126 TaxID=3365952 RepID=UPI003830BEFD
MDDLVQFLRDRYDEDEQAARAVGYERIETGEYMWNSKYLLLQGGKGGESKATAEFDGDLADHIARHDPARVLREVEAKRQLLNDHPIERETYPRPASGGKDVGGPHFPFGCATCHAEPDTGEVHGFGYCLTWKALALPYADHPDYQDNWRP